MLLLGHEDIAGLLSPAQVIASVRAALVEQSKAQVQLPPRTTIESASGYGWLRLMPAILNGSQIMGYKAMHSTPKVGVGYYVALYDLPTGELLAEMDADWITAQRTAATAALGVDILARKDIHCTGILGSGEQARALLTATAQVRKLSRVKVFSPTAAHRSHFADQMSKQLNLDIVAVAQPEEAVVGSDLVLSVFRANSKPLVSADWISPGTHLSASSAVRPTTRELEDEVWRKCSVIAVDDREHALGSGDGRSGLASKSLDPEKIHELWELIDHQKVGRKSEQDITLFKSVGTALQDLALAKAIYDVAKQRGLGMDVGRFPRMRPHA